MLKLSKLELKPSLAAKKKIDFENKVIVRPSKKNTFLVRISIKKRTGGRFFFFFFLLFTISYCLLSLHIITFPQVYVGALRSNINKTQHQILIKHKLVKF